MVSLTIIIFSNLGMKPICFAAMEKRSREAYIFLFNGLKQASAAIGFNLSPSLHMMDFEVAAAQASKNVFINTSISFCHFHFAKSIWRNIRKNGEFNALLRKLPADQFKLTYILLKFDTDLGLVTISRTEQVRREIANVIALPLIPSSLVCNRFETIRADLHSINSTFSSFIKYFRRTYVNSTRFPIQTWNHYDFLGTRPRTNNHLEGAHRQLKT